MFWFIFSFLVIVFAYLGDENNIIYNNNVKLFRVLLIITLSYVVGFAGQSFTDHENYVSYYNRVQYLDIEFSINSIFNFKDRTLGLEFGYLVLNKLCYFFGLGPPGLFFVVGLIVNTLIVKVFYQFENPVLIFLIFIMSAHLSQQMNLVRQMIGVALFLYSIRYLIHKKTLSYLMLIVAASLFHASALILIIFTPLSLINIERKKSLALIILLSLWLLSLTTYLGILNINIMSFVPMFSKYEIYYTTDFNVGMTLSGNIIYNFSVFLLFVFYTKNNIPIIYTLFFILGVIILNISVSFLSLSRFSYYFTILFSAYLPTMLSGSLYTNIKKIYLTRFLFLVSSFYYSYSLFAKFVFNDDVLLGSKMYSVYDFFL